MEQPHDEAEALFHWLADTYHMGGLLPHDALRAIASALSTPPRRLTLVGQGGKDKSLLCQYVRSFYQERDNPCAVQTAVVNEWVETGDAIVAGLLETQRALLCVANVDRAAEPWEKASALVGAIGEREIICIFTCKTLPLPASPVWGRVVHLK